ncbi:MAG: hypothetical protein R6U13_03535 [Desulfatiglandaceae bacterium]
MKLRSDPYQVFRESKTPAGLYSNNGTGTFIKVSVSNLKNAPPQNTIVPSQELHLAVQKFQLNRV